MDFDPSLRIREDPDVYRPGDDSYLLLGAIRVAPGDRFLEVGTGTGLVALHAAKVARSVATDSNPRAVELARDNALENGRALEVVRCDLAAGVRGPFDVVAFNPPYLEGAAEDGLGVAWSGGEGGSEVAVRFLDELPRLLAPEARAYLLLSRANAAAWEVAASSFRAAAVASKSLFFETLDVLELRAKP